MVVPAVGFLGSVLRGGCWWPGSSGPLCLLLIAGGGAVYCGSYTLITKHCYHVGPVPWVLHVHAHTHTHIH